MSWAILNPNMAGQKANIKNGRINDTFGNVLYIPNATGPSDVIFSSKAVNIPVGVYDCEISANGVPLSNTLDLELIGAISYNYTNEYYYDQSGVKVQLYIPIT